MYTGSDNWGDTDEDEICWNAYDNAFTNRGNSSIADRNKSMRMTTTKPGFNKYKTIFNGLCTFYFKKNLNRINNYDTFLEESRSQIINLLKNHVQEGPVKYCIKLESTFIIPNTEKIENRAFKTSSRTLVLADDINELLQLDYDKLKNEEQEMALKGSSFSLDSIDGIMLNVNKYRPLGGASYIPLPTFIENKKATINVQNSDNKCFQYSILSKFIKSSNPHRPSKEYEELENKYNFTQMDFPVKLQDIKKFENINKNVSINVYTVKWGQLTYKNNTFKRTKLKNDNVGQFIIYPLKVCRKEHDDHHDLLLIDDGTKRHYCAIKNFVKLISSQISRHGHSFIICKRCFKTYSTHKNRINAENKMLEHKIKCDENKPLLPILPKENTYIKFENWDRTNKHPFSIYADMESILEKCHDNDPQKNSKIIHNHELMSYCFYVKPSEDVPIELINKFGIETLPVVFRGDSSCQPGDISRKFMLDIIKVSLKIENLLQTNASIIMTYNDIQIHKNTVLRGNCPLCKSKFNINNLAVRDHNHLNGKYRRTVCNNCNLKMKRPKFVPCYFHNLSGYDSHLFIRQLGIDGKPIRIIPNTEEKLISFSKQITKDFHIRFVDTFRFMASSLDKLSNNLGQSNFKETLKVFSPAEIDLVTRKGFFPYQFVDCWSKLDDVQLPPKTEFYNTLSEQHISDADYAHAIRVWDHYKFNSLGEYSDWYLKVDVLLLCDVFENFRYICLKTYGLDANYYYSAPGMSWDCCLKYTEVELELLTDYDKVLMIEAGIRGGLTQAVKRYSKANNYKVPEYDNSKPDSWIIYLDATNLYVYIKNKILRFILILIYFSSYGWAMMQFLPKNNFCWYNGSLDVDNIIKALDDLDDESEIGMILQVDVLYPSMLHDKHNDLPYLPEKTSHQGSKIKKLTANLNNKYDYIVHYRSLKQSIKAGLQLVKVHRILKFNQSPWLLNYIQLNTNMRKNATNDFDKDFYKLMNNSVFGSYKMYVLIVNLLLIKCDFLGKTMENVRNRMKMELVSNDKKCTKLINKSNFKSITLLSDNLCAVHLFTEELHFNKPIYAGLSILDISKTLMYDFHYEIMKAHFDTKLDLMYMDTG